MYSGLDHRPQKLKSVRDSSIWPSVSPHTAKCYPVRHRHQALASLDQVAHY